MLTGPIIDIELHFADAQHVPVEEIFVWKYVIRVWDYASK
jgi:hypothetical protein